jgi:bromodomain-containing factor 1
MGPLSASGERPKREIQTMMRDQPLESFGRPPRKLTPQLKFASSLLRDLTKKHYAPYNLAFLQPVDPEALGIPQYRDIIKNPMDLSTIRRKLDNGQYEDGDEFDADIRLMFQNCYTFNAPGSEVYNLGKELEAVYDRKWAGRPPPGDYEEKPRRVSQPVAYEMDDMDEDSSEDDGMFIHFAHC